MAKNTEICEFCDTFVKKSSPGAPPDSKSGGFLDTFVKSQALTDPKVASTNTPFATRTPAHGFEIAEIANLMAVKRRIPRDVRQKRSSERIPPNSPTPSGAGPTPPPCGGLVKSPFWAVFSPCAVFLDLDRRAPPQSSALRAPTGSGGCWR